MVCSHPQPPAILITRRMTVYLSHQPPQTTYYFPKNSIPAFFSAILDSLWNKLKHGMHISTLQLEQYTIPLMTYFSFLAIAHICNWHIPHFSFGILGKCCIDVLNRHLNCRVEGCKILFLIDFFFDLYLNLKHRRRKFLRLYWRRNLFFSLL